MPRHGLKNALQTLLSFSKRERRRVLLLLPLLVLLSLLFTRWDRSVFEQSFTRYTDRVLDSLQAARYAQERDEFSSRSGAPRPHSGENPATSQLAAPSGNNLGNGILFPFDPNTVSGEELVRLGFSPKQAAAILRYRSAGARFHRPEEFKKCYTVSPQKYRQLSPYIVIGDAYRDDRPTLWSAEKTSLRRSATPAPSPVSGNKERQIASSFKETDFSRPSPQTHFTSPLLELNSADSAALVALRGIGPLTATRILRYREALGGYASTAQLREIAGMNDENYTLILQQIRVDSSKIQKIDINFATPKQMQGHPYLPPKVLNRLLKYRQLKGGWSNTTELIEQHIMSLQQAERLSVYLDFRTKSL